jgi:hypothetical protein
MHHSDEGPAETPNLTRKEWRQPTLRKLTIAATASSTKGGLTADDGGAGGKGDLLRHS